MKTILPVKFIYVSNWYNFIVILIEFIWVKPFKGKRVSHWKNVICRCRHWTTDFVTAFEHVELMLPFTLDKSLVNKLFTSWLLVFISLIIFLYCKYAYIFKNVHLCGKWMLSEHLNAFYWIYTEIKMQNNLGWKRPLQASSPEKQTFTKFYNINFILIWLSLMILQSIPVKCECFAWFKHTTVPLYYMAE